MSQRATGQRIMFHDEQVDHPVTSSSHDEQSTWLISPPPASKPPSGAGGGAGGEGGTTRVVIKLHRGLGDKVMPGKWFALEREGGGAAQRRHSA